ncbi:hypothetical protein ACNHKD_17165 [Methylocystis sp. JAN1]|uniref:hypothetical protein n=1 Tax=Methylocystis sp. JAN1 TaxID=3397211 RepID=UPI003FA20753
MSICFALDSALPPEKTKERISLAREKYADVLSYFWISEVRASDPYEVEDDAEYGFLPKAAFMIQWNKDRSEFIRMIPEIFWEVFGEENLLIRDDSCDVITRPYIR